MPPSDPVAQLTEMEWIQFLGIEPVEAVEGKAIIRLDPKPVHLNHNRTVNAPILYALAEVAGAGAVVGGMLELAAQNYVVIKKASIEYLAPARGAVTATGQISIERFAETRDEVARSQPAEVEVPVTVRDASGTEVARCQLWVSIRPRRTANAG